MKHPKIHDGSTFGSLTVLKARIKRKKPRSSKAGWVYYHFCQCICKRMKIIKDIDLKTGKYGPCACPKEKIEDEEDHMPIENVNKRKWKPSGSDF